jgi:hypothetical protein
MWSPELRLFFVLRVERGVNLTNSTKETRNGINTKAFKPEQIVNLLREIEVMMANGKTLLESCKQAGISDKSYYRWRRIYGGLKVDQARKFKEIEAENARLRKLVAELSLRESMLKEVVKGNY